MLNLVSISCLATLSLLLHSHHSFSVHTNETDRLALLVIKSKLHDPLEVTSSWNNSINLCQWTGVTCGRRHQRVTKLILRNHGIGGILSPYVGNLSFLRYINLANNEFHGEIPHEVSNLFRLENIRLANNSFSGKIPTNLSRCSNLIEITLDGNNLVGEISAEIGYLLKLELLAIRRNHLTGQLPASIGNLSSIQVIDIQWNRLEGRIPNTLGQLRNLEFLAIGGNLFSGEIPPTIYNISSFVMIYLHLNRLHGSLPFDIGVKLPHLRVFEIGGNNFTGSIPDSFSNASKLQILALSGNQFSGKVSIRFNNLENLYWLNLRENDFGNRAANDLDFVTLLTNCSKLRSLDLSVNRFGGVLPHSIANLSTTISAIFLGGNQISGTIPLGIRNLVNLNALAMEYNQLTGTIPSVIGELKNLQALLLVGNFFRGNIPATLGNLSLLSDLSLGSNKLQGNIPSSLGNCNNLMTLSVFQNQLTGALPPQILSIPTLSLVLDLSDNLLKGSLPVQVGNLKNLILLNISQNQFSGEIPVTLGACVSLEKLFMQGNSFKGSIPQSLSSLKSIKVLDLSSNNLSGQIPEFLENLRFLEYLNMSYNHFEGRVPMKGVFGNKTGISILGNGKLCGGLDEMELPSCQSRGSRKSIGTLLKVMVPLIVSCLILSTCFMIVYARRRRSLHKSSNMVQLEQHFPMVSYAELSMATNAFSSSNMIGQGSFGFVYKGVLGENEMLVAVKVLNLMRKGASKSFVAECEALRNIRHRNLLKIITVCSSIDFLGADFKALVYEYMQNGSLEEWIHQSNNDQLEVCNLSLVQRINIAIDVASAIEYLHHHCQPPIIHGDIKPSNVLLDHNMVAHVGDFGIARFLFEPLPCTIQETQSSSLGIQGTVGYVAPEYGMGGRVSMPGDVYSFGILLLEMFTRKRPTDSMFNDGLTLHEFAKTAFREKVMEIVEPSLLLELGTGNSMIHVDERVKIEECLVAVVRTGVLCSMESPTERMEMRDAVAKLHAAREIIHTLSCLQQEARGRNPRRDEQPVEA